MSHPFLLLLLTLTLPFTTADRYTSSPTTTLTDWQPARATFYAAYDPRDTVAGACGYGDLVRRGFGLATVGVSSELFNRGQICGGCFELRCVDDLKYCHQGTSIIVTATNFCPPNYGLESDSGGHCNPPNKHFVLPIDAFEKIAFWKASNMNVQFRRIKCVREGGIRFIIDGGGFFIGVLISNVAGAGDVMAVKIKGTKTGWLPMGRNWGQIWHVSAALKNQPLSFEVTTRDGVTVTSYNVAPKNWEFGQSFVGKQFES
ncbi:Expansin-A13 [Ranunculus cassubicifolius]